jgi:excisionase family DNA binding protein
MEIVKKCEWCHKTFIAQMVTARFCSSKCCDQAYRYKRKVQSGKYTPVDEGIDMSTIARRVDERKHLNESLKDKEFLSPSEAAKLLGVCRSTIYNYLWQQYLRAKQFRGKTIIRRSDIEKLFDEAPAYKKRGNTLKGKKTQTDYYSLKEMMEKFKISKRTVFRRCD